MKLISNNFIQSVGAEVDIFNVFTSLKKEINNQDPFFICKLSEIISKYHSWKMMFPRVKPFYGVNTNSNSIVLETLAGLGVGFECTTKNDMIQASSVAGSNSIFLSVPLKTANLIKHASNSSVHLISFDTESELEKILKFYPQAKLLIHVRSLFDEEMSYNFGCDPDTSYKKLLKLACSLNLNVVGIHFNIEPEGKQEAYSKTIELARKLFDVATSVGYDFNLLSLGRGFPTDCLNELAEEVNNALDNYFPDNSVDVIANPAQFFVESAFTLSCHIEYIRQVNKTDPITGIPYTHYEYFINDGVFGSFNNVFWNKQNINLQPLNNYPLSKTYSSSIWGPTSSALDRIIEEVSLPEMKIGDSIIFDNMGYFTPSCHNGFPPQEVYVLANEENWSHMCEDQQDSKEIYFVMENNAEDYSQECFDEVVNLPDILHIDSCNMLK